MEEVSGSEISAAASSLQRARELAAMGEHQPAVELLDEAIALDASNPQLWVARAGLRAGDDSDAWQADFEQAMVLCPRDSLMHLERGRIWRRRCQWERALEDFSQAALLRHDLHEAYFERAQTYVAMVSSRSAEGTDSTDEKGLDHLRHAVRDYSIAFRIQPEAVFLMARAASHEMAQAWTEALADYDRVLAVSRPVDEHYLAATEGKARVSPKLVMKNGERPLSAGQDSDMDRVRNAAALLAREEARQPEAADDAMAAVAVPDTTVVDTAASKEVSEAREVARRVMDRYFRDDPVNYVEAGDDAWQSADGKGCEKFTDELTALGFRSLGDFEAVHFTAIVGGRAPVRLLVDPRGRTVVSIRHELPPLFPGPVSWTGRWLRRSPSRELAVEFEAEMADGRFLVTRLGRASDGLAMPPQVDEVCVAGAAELAQCWKVHSERVRAYKTNRAPMTDVPVRDLLQASQLQERRRVLTLAWRIATDGSDEEGMTSVLGPRYRGIQVDVQKELIELLESTGEQESLS